MSKMNLRCPTCGEPTIKPKGQQRTIAALLTQSGGTSSAELAKVIGCSQQAAAGRLERMVKSANPWRKPLPGGRVRYYYLQPKRKTK